MSLVSMILFGIATTVFVVGFIVAMFIDDKKSVTLWGGSIIVAILLSGIAGILWGCRMIDVNDDRMVSQSQQTHNCTVIGYGRYSGTMLWTVNDSLHYSIKTKCDGCEDGYMWIDYIP